MPSGPKTTLTLKRYVDTLDAVGSPTRVWSTVDTVKGVLLGISGEERAYQDRIVVDATHRFWFNYDASLAITEKDQFVDATRTFKIEFLLDPGEKHVFVKAYLKELK